MRSALPTLAPFYSPLVLCLQLPYGDLEEKCKAVAFDQHFFNFLVHYYDHFTLFMSQYGLLNYSITGATDQKEYITIGGCICILRCYRTKLEYAEMAIC